MLSVSVLILSYNHLDYIEEAINSVFIQKEHLDDLELIVLDDGSDDGTPDLLKQIQQRSPISMKILLNEHKGVNAISRNFNSLIKLAKNKYIAFLASDDSFKPDRFRKQIAVLENDENCQFVYANGVNILKGENIGLVHSDFVVDLLRRGVPHEVYEYVTSTTPQLYIQSILVKSSFFKYFSPFNEDLIADDWVFNINCFDKLIKQNQNFGYVDQVVVSRHILQNSTSNNAPVHFKRIAQTAEIYINSKKRLFYRKFYWNYIKVFMLQRQFKKSIILSIRLVLLYLSIPFHNKWLSNII